MLFYFVFGQYGTKSFSSQNIMYFSVCFDKRGLLSTAWNIIQNGFEGICSNFVNLP